MQAYQIRKAVLELKRRNVPGYASLGGAYGGIVNVVHAENLQGDLIERLSVQNNSMGYQKQLINGEIGTIAGMVLVEDNFATQFAYDKDDRTALSKASNACGGRDAADIGFAQASVHSANADGADAFFFGSPCVREAIVIPEEIRAKIPGDYGRSKGIAWYFLGGFKIEWGDLAADSNDARIIHWSSL